MLPGKPETKTPARVQDGVFARSALSFREKTQRRLREDEVRASISHLLHLNPVSAERPDAWYWRGFAPDPHITRPEILHTSISQNTVGFVGTIPSDHPKDEYTYAVVFEALCDTEEPEVAANVSFILARTVDLGGNRTWAEHLRREYSSAPNWPRGSIYTAPCRDIGLLAVMNLSLAGLPAMAVSDREATSAVNLSSNNAQAGLLVA